ncbi:Hypothetical predicted protein [Marmota monax]|uniref:Uncharacterized protein n=1 Tax=Marmota monax TaxID=9995 RepID=A0A5E4B5P6_MARMO|nr:hypothetical protein GHT09_017865 [Marmota monax]VTJ64460.1 Hypothetical predicted protein [Marmota monax]
MVSRAPIMMQYSEVKTRLAKIPNGVSHNFEQPRPPALPGSRRSATGRNLAGAFVPNLDSGLGAVSGALSFPRPLDLNQVGTTARAEPPSWKGEDPTGSTTLGAACLQERHQQLLSA